MSIDCPRCCSDKFQIFHSGASSKATTFQDLSYTKFLFYVVEHQCNKINQGHLGGYNYNGYRGDTEFIHWSKKEAQEFADLKNAEEESKNKKDVKISSKIEFSRATWYSAINENLQKLESSVWNSNYWLNDFINEVESAVGLDEYSDREELEIDEYDLRQALENVEQRKKEDNPEYYFMPTTSGIINYVRAVVEGEEEAEELLPMAKVSLEKLDEFYDSIMKAKKRGSTYD